MMGFESVVASPQISAVKAQQALDINAEVRCYSRTIIGEKMKKLIFIICISFTQNILATSASDVKLKTSQAAEEASQYTKEQKDAFVKEMDENLASIKTKIKKVKDKTAASTDETLVNLDAKEKKLEKDIEKMKISGDKAWGHLKKGVIKSWNEVKTAVNEATGEFSK